MKIKAVSLVCGLLLFLAGFATAENAVAASVRIVGGVPQVMMPVNQLLATGAFTAVDTFDIQGATPVLADLIGYNAVLAFTDNPPADPVQLGNVLADYVDAGGMLVLATYSFSRGFGISGRIMTPGYSPLTTVGVNGLISGTVVPIDPVDRLFNGIDPAQIRFFFNDSYSHPGVDASATLLATDGAGINLIAKNSAGNVIGMNLYPGFINESYYTPELYQLFANALLYNSIPVRNPSNGHWYQRFDTTMTWHQAKAFCDAKGGYLATVTSQEENDFVYGELAAPGAPQWSWLGATDESIEGIWKWVTPEPFSYTNWAGGEPNNCNTENYLMYFTPPDGRAGSWNDLNTGNSSTDIPGGCGCGGCQGEWYSMSTICEWGGFCTKAPAGMISWWTGDGSAKDSVDGNHGTLVNGAFAPGKVGSAFSFDGVNGYVDVGNAQNLHVSSGDFTVDAWVLFDALTHEEGTTLAPPGDMSIVDKMSAQYVNVDGWRLLKQDDNRFWFCLGGRDGNRCGDPAFTVFSSTVAETGKWYHVAAVKNSAGITIYVNGVREDSRSPLPDFLDTNSTNLLIGSQAVEIARLNGLVDEVEIFNRALTDDEIKANYLTGSAGKCKVIDVAVDIRPGNFPNSINPFTKGVVPVAVLTTPAFDAAAVDPATMRFGPNGAAPASSSLKDVDGDGDIDLILQFKIQETGIVCVTTIATLTGKTFEGHTIQGSDSVNTVGCR